MLLPINYLEKDVKINMSHKVGHHRRFEDTIRVIGARVAQ